MKSPPRENTSNLVRVSAAVQAVPVRGWYSGFTRGSIIGKRSPCADTSYSKFGVRRWGGVVLNRNCGVEARNAAWR
jgi:hypothetical protein